MTDGPRADAAPRRRLVLIVEDNEDNRIVYRTYLEHMGYEVLTAEDGESGVELATAAHPDVIVMDVGLPGIDGYVATERLKADQATRGIPVVILTAHVHQEDRERARQAGGDRFLTKPLEPRALGVEIQRLLDATEPVGG